MEKELNKFLLNLQLFADDDDDKDEEIEDEDILSDEDFADVDEENDEDDEDSDGSDKQDKEPSESEKKKQSQEENARQAKLRREKEQKEKEAREAQIRKEAYEKGKLEATKVNPFTNKPIEDPYDLKIYELQRKIQENGGDPIEDLPSELARMEREENRKKQEAAKAAAEAKAKEEERILNEINEFKTKHKGVDPRKVLQDPLFNRFSNGKLGSNASLSQVYEDFLEFQKLVATTKLEEEEKKKQDEEAKKKGIPPSPNGGKTKEGKTDYSKLSREERIKFLKGQGLIR